MLLQKHQVVITEPSEVVTPVMILIPNRTHHRNSLVCSLFTARHRVSLIDTQQAKQQNQ